MAFPHLFSPLQMGPLTLPNRIVHVPTDISSSNADGEVSERDIHHHGNIAKGGAGFVIVGATTPDMKTGRPTVTCLVADGDNYVPGLARLAESMHRYGAKAAVQLQHPGRQCAIPRYNTLGATDRILKLPWSAVHEIIYENAEEKGKEIREASIAAVAAEVGLSIVPENALARAFRDAAGLMHQDVARLAASVTLVVAGCPVKVK